MGNTGSKQPPERWRRGSSPRSWGTQGKVPARIVQRRFIPTLVGNTPARIGAVAILCGSSPRSWGTRRSVRLCQRHLRFIPTLVGNTRAETGAHQCRTVHPHARGEHVRAIGVNHPNLGSSPRSWGTHAYPRGTGEPGRFIPTLVGNTEVAAAGGEGAAVHPHARGEHPSTSASPSKPAGSSPRSWGTRESRCCSASRRRFIPTLVGNTLTRSVIWAITAVHPHARGEHVQRATGRYRRPAVHPHARGEHLMCSIRSAGTRGSSPRSWGTRPGRRKLMRPCRFIPTLVGNTTVPKPRLAWAAVHPHARGEHFSRASSRACIAGSSPRSWGTRMGNMSLWDSVRFIPTLVGNTTHISTWRVALSGSSPRSWGTRARWQRGAVWLRFIPTLVGNTLFISY